MDLVMKGIGTMINHMAREYLYKPMEKIFKKVTLKMEISKTGEEMLKKEDKN